MDGNDRIHEAFERSVKAVTLRPAMAQSTATTRAVLRPGLDCTVSEGPYELKVAMSKKLGGNGGAPNPGVLGRGALASCLAVGYGIWAARLGVPCESVEVEVQADYDSRGELGMDDGVRPGYSEIRYIVTVVSTCPEAEVMRLLDTADRYSPYRDVFAHQTPLHREVRITAPVK